MRTTWRAISVGNAAWSAFARSTADRMLSSGWPAQVRQKRREECVGSPCCCLICLQVLEHATTTASRAWGPSRRMRSFNRCNVGKRTADVRLARIQAHQIGGPDQSCQWGDIGGLDLPQISGTLHAVTPSSEKNTRASYGLGWRRRSVIVRLVTTHRGA